MFTQVKPGVLRPLARRINELGLDQLPDRRNLRGFHRHSLKSLAHALMIGMLTARASLPKVENLTAKLSPRVRKITGIYTRISDTKLRDFQQTLLVEDLRQVLHRQTKIEHRRGSLRPIAKLPFGVVAIDGKGLGLLDTYDHPSVQRVNSRHGVYGKARVHRATLISTPAALCIDQRPVPGDTNEIGAFPKTLDELLEVYGNTKIFEMIVADAGNASAATATRIDAAQYAYLLRLKLNHGTIHTHASAVLDEASPEYDWCVETGKGDKRVTHVYRLYRVKAERPLWACRRKIKSGDPINPYGWGHLRQWIRIEHAQYNVDGLRTSVARRDWATNMPWNRVPPVQWVEIIRRYWRCENNNHWTADVFFKEDAKRQPWTTDAETLYMLATLRMIALNILALRRAMSRSPARPNEPLSWQETIELVLIWAITSMEYQKPHAMIG